MSSLVKKISELKKKLRYSKYFNSYDPFVKIPEKKFLIYTRGRTGSTVLTELLNSHPEMYCDYEIFDIRQTKTIIKDLFRFIDSCSKRSTLNKKSVYGFKVKIEQLKNEHKIENVSGVLKTLHDKGWKIIYLKRENVLQHTISGIVSNQTNVFHVRNKEFSHEKILIDCNILIGVMDYFKDLERQEEESLINISHHIVLYEKDLLDNSKHQTTADNVFKFLGLNSYPVNTRLKKIIPEDLSNIISNYDEVRDFISKGKYKEYLSW